MTLSIRAAALAAALTAGTSAMTHADEVTLINVFEVPEGKYEETVAMWEAARDVMKRQPGYVSTALQASLTPDARFRLVNIARWESPAAFAAAAAALKDSPEVPKVEGLAFTPGLYRTIRED